MGGPYLESYKGDVRADVILPIRQKTTVSLMTGEHQSVRRVGVQADVLLSARQIQSVRELWLRTAVDDDTSSQRGGRGKSCVGRSHLSAAVK